MIYQFILLARGNMSNAKQRSSKLFFKKIEVEPQEEQTCKAISGIPCTCSQRMRIKIGLEKIRVISNQSKTKTDKTAKLYRSMPIFTNSSSTFQ